MNKAARTRGTRSPTRRAKSRPETVAPDGTKPARATRKNHSERSAPDAGETPNYVALVLPVGSSDLPGDGYVFPVCQGPNCGTPCGLPPSLLAHWV